MANYGLELTVSLLGTKHAEPLRDLAEVKLPKSLSGGTTSNKSRIESVALRVFGGVLRVCRFPSLEEAPPAQSGRGT